MSSTYTALLWSDGDVPAGITPGPTVPAGVLWVVRDVQLYWGGPLYELSVSGIVLQATSDHSVIAGVGQGDACPQRLFSLELRQVLTAGDSLRAVSGDDGWSLRVSGYAFNTT